ncbi:hypothetical protein KDA23_02895 [Candidatus Saccharibacteria bacterium]|nr:hypothetical protein [Candidatus Saccharibacteria bacterium]
MAKREQSPLDGDMPLYPEHLESFDAFGRLAVIYAEGALFHEIHADREAEEADYFSSLVPEPGTRPTLFARMRHSGRDRRARVWMKAHDYPEGYNFEAVAEHLRANARADQAEATSHQVLLVEELQVLRQELSKLSPDQADAVGAMVYRIDFLSRQHNNWLNDNNLTPQQLTAFQWLIQPPSEGRDVDLRLLNFLQHHNYHMERYNEDPTLKGRIKAEKDRLVRGITSILPITVGQVESALQETKIYCGDEFTMAFGGLCGKYSYSFNRILLEKGFSQHTFDHEACHAIGGFPDIVWNEAITEHIALVMENGDPDIINPSLRQEEGAYAGYRLIVANVLEMAGAPSMNQVLATYAESDSDGPAGRHFVKTLAQAYGGYSVTDFIYTRLMQRRDTDEVQNFNQAARFKHWTAEETSGVARDLLILQALLKGKSAKEIGTRERMKVLLEAAKMTNPTGAQVYKEARLSDTSRSIVEIVEYLEDNQPAIDVAARKIEE